MIVCRDVKRSVTFAAGHISPFAMFFKVFLELKIGCLE